MSSGNQSVVPSASGVVPSASDSVVPSVSPAAALVSDNSIPNAVSLCSLLCLHLQPRCLRLVFGNPSDPALSEHPIWAQRGIAPADACLLLAAGVQPAYLLAPGETQEYSEAFFNAISGLHAASCFERDIASANSWSTPRPTRSVSSTASTVVDVQLRRPAPAEAITPLYTFGSFHVHDENGEDIRDRDVTLPMLHERAALGYTATSPVPVPPAVDAVASVVQSASPSKRSKIRDTVSCSDQDDEDLVALSAST